jgi:hypothetical protein
LGGPFSKNYFIQDQTMNVEEVKLQIQELQKVRQQTRRMRLLTVLALLVIVVSGVSGIITSASSLAQTGPRQDLFLKTLGGYLQRDLMPPLQSMANRSLSRLKPAVAAELQQANRRGPEVAQVALQQLNLMGEELPSQAGKILDQNVDRTMHLCDVKLRHLYPGLYDKQITGLINNLTLEAQDQLAQSGETLFHPHLNAVQHILANLDKIRQTEPVAADPEIDPWQTTFMFMDLFVTEFKDIAPAPAGAPAGNANPHKP